MNQPPTEISPRKPWLIAGSAAGVIVIGLVSWLIIGAGAEEPRLNESTPVLAKFISSRAFERMPYEKQRGYYRILDDRGGKEIDQAFTEGKITEGEYRNALDAAWLGKHINRFEKYASLPPGRMRSQYIDELLVKKLAKDAKKEGKKDDGESDKINEDEAAAEMRVESWPPAVREQWKLFHDAYRREKTAREEAAARPTSRPQ